MKKYLLIILIFVVVTSCSNALYKAKPQQKEYFSIIA